MNNQTTNSATMVVRFGQAMHMDLSRASDEKLAAAYKTLDEYDTRGEASAYTQDKIDRRLSEIDDEGDRREGVEPTPWNPNPTSHVVGVSSTIAERDIEGDFDADGIPADDMEPDEVPVQLTLSGQMHDPDAEQVMDDDDTPAETRREIEHIVSELDPATTDGLVPGETSAI